MILLVDAGNTRIKASLYDGATFLDVEPFSTTIRVTPKAWQAFATPQAVFVSNVAGEEVAAAIDQWVTELWGASPHFASPRREAAGMQTDYDDPTRLGVDRWLAALAGYRIADGAACVVDAGTALTIDIVSQEGRHLGGSISPGLSLMVASLTHNTARLQLDELHSDATVATNTAVAISSGCIDAFVGGVERMQQRLADYGVIAPRWFATGGEAEVLMRSSALDFTHVPDLVLRGLSYLTDECS